MGRINIYLILLAIAALSQTACQPTAEKVNMNLPEVVWPAGARLGEGAFWHNELQELWWIDIEGKKFYQFRPGQGDSKTTNLPARIGTVVPVAGENYALLALENGLERMNLITTARTPVTHPAVGIDSMRYNDGKVDPEGRLWVGTMHLAAKPDAAALYRVEADGATAKMLDKITISNGICWSADGRTMYYIDTPTRQVRAYPFTPSTGAIGPAEVVVEIPEDLGFPDGMTIDAEGMLWVAMYDGFGVTRWNPEDGKLLERVSLPVPKVTSVAFGGPDLTDLYITTAREGMSEEELAEYPQSGHLFKVKTTVKGVLLPHYGEKK